MLTRGTHTVTASQTVMKKRKLSGLRQPPDGLEMCILRCQVTGENYDFVSLIICRIIVGLIHNQSLEVDRIILLVIAGNKVISYKCFPKIL